MVGSGVAESGIEEEPQEIDRPAANADLSTKVWTYYPQGGVSWIKRAARKRRPRAA
jgi:hypothetical protein